MKIGLALSGGGFRATLFHLGVIEGLRQQGTLKRIDEVSGVSGGSVIAAHLVSRWSEYTGTDEDFQRSAKQIIDLTQLNIRGRVLRRKALRALAVVPLFFKSSRTGALLEAQYRILFGEKTFADLRAADLGGDVDVAKERIARGIVDRDSGAVEGGSTREEPVPEGQRSKAPRLSVLATSLNTGQIVAFESDGVRFWPPYPGRQDHSAETSMPLARAVAASAAFPVLSTPVLLEREFLGFDEREGINHLLTDGGVYDNLGALWLAIASSERLIAPLDYLIVSDAGRPVDWSTEKSASGLVRRNFRASDLLMSRLARYDFKKVQKRVKQNSCRLISIEHRYSRGYVGCPSPRERYRASRVRTDLNRFSNDEIALLRAHGRHVTVDVIGAKPIT